MDSTPRPCLFSSIPSPKRDPETFWQELEPSLAAGAAYAAAPDQWAASGSDLSLVRFCVQQGKAPVMGVLSPTGLDWEPYGELPFLELVNIYAHRAFELLEAGVSALWVEGALSLGEARAAVLGARQTGLPIHLTMAVDADGESPQNADVLASLVTLQGLGIQSFGLAFTGGEEDLLDLVEHLIPHARIPLAVCLPLLAPEELARLTRELLSRGVSRFYTAAGMGKEALLPLTSLFAQAFSLPPAEEETLAACADQTFFLREDMAYSDLLECSVDMADQVISAEDSGCEILQIHIGSLDDAYQFGLNADMMRLPVSLVADNVEALETALIYYNGRAIIDSLCDLDEETISTLAKGYNALVL